MVIFIAAFITGAGYWPMGILSSGIRNLKVPAWLDIQLQHDLSFARGAEVHISQNAVYQNAYVHVHACT